MIGMSVADWYAQELEKHQKLWEAEKMLPALFQTVRFCFDVQITLPEWAAIGLLNLIQDRFHDGFAPGKSGRMGSIKGQFRQNYAHYLRWKAVKSALFKLSLDEFSWVEFPAEKGRRKKGDTSPTQGKILKEASLLLKGKLEKQGGVNQIGKSYQKVEKSRKAGELKFAFDLLYYDIE